MVRVNRAGDAGTATPAVRMTQTPKLNARGARLVGRKPRARCDAPIGEQDTKAALIEPVLRALGWDVEDLEEVQREYRLKSARQPGRLRPVHLAHPPGVPGG